jgi:hypothetical protein
VFNFKISGSKEEINWGRIKIVSKDQCAEEVATMQSFSAKHM